MLSCMFWAVREDKRGYIAYSRPKLLLELGISDDAG